MLDTAHPDEWTETLEDVVIRIRAADRDHAKSGWAAVVPSLSDKRVRLLIVPGIDLDTLAAKGEVRGDVIVYFRRGRKGEERPASVHLYKLRGPDGGTSAEQGW